MKSRKMNVYEQDCWGTVQWRVIPGDDEYFLGRITMDFDGRREAIDAIRGDARRTKYKPIITVYEIGRKPVTLNEIPH